MASEPPEICPLDRFLDKHEKSVVAFCLEASLSRHTIYDLLNGVPKNYSTNTLRVIERATGGKVTIRQLIVWIESLAHRNNDHVERKGYRPHRSRLE